MDASTTLPIGEKLSNVSVDQVGENTAAVVSNSSTETAVTTLFKMQPAKTFEEFKASLRKQDGIMKQSTLNFRPSVEPASSVEPKVKTKISFLGPLKTSKPSDEVASVAPDDDNTPFYQSAVDDDQYTDDVLLSKLRSV